MAFDARMHAALFANRERRRDLFARAGMGTPLADSKLPGPDAAIANPLTGTQEQELATLVARIESFNGSPSGDLVVTGDATDRAVLAGDGAGRVSLTVRVAGLDEIASGATAPDDDISSGIHTYVLAFDPANGRAKVYVDGRLVIDEVDAGATKWASITATWNYAGSATQVGLIEPLEVHPGRVPAIF